MKRDEFHEIILNELKDLKSEIKEVRQTDIPSIKTDVAGFRTDIKTLKDGQTWSTRIYTVLGGAITLAIAKFTEHH